MTYWVIAGIALLLIIMSAVKIIVEWERGVLFRLGRLVGERKPGLNLIIPLVDTLRKIDTRVITLDVPPQDVITRDNVTVRVNAVVYFRVVDPTASLVRVENYKTATWQMSQTTLRNVLGQSELDQLLSDREQLNQKVQKIIDEHTDPWGLKVSTVEIKDVELPESMRRSMAAQAEAERERRAKVIHADGEYQAAEKLSEAGALIAREPTTLQLRYLQTLTEIATEKNSTIIFPFPMEFLKAFPMIPGLKQREESKSEDK